VIFPEWTGVGDYIKKRARMFAALGYVAFAADIYGECKQVQPGPEAGAESGKYMKDRPLLRQRTAAGLDVLRKHANVDAAKLIAVGYCFGSGAAL
jgi:dienelactone hydrolase